MNNKLSQWQQMGNTNDNCYVRLRTWEIQLKKNFICNKS